MWESSNLAEKKFNAESHKLIGEAQLHKFGVFLDEFSCLSDKVEKEFTNKHNVSMQLVLIDEQLYKTSSLFSLVHSDHKNLGKILACLACLCNEMKGLIAEAESMYSNFLLVNEVNNIPMKYLLVSKMIEPLQKAHLFVRRVQEVTISTLRQLCTILRNKPALGGTCMFSEVLNTFGSMLICLLKLDCLLEINVLKEHWFLYRKTIRNSLHNNNPNFNKNQLRAFDKMLLTFENDLLRGTILKNLIESLLEDKEFYFELKSSSLNNELMLYINILIHEFEKDDNVETETFLKMNILLSLHCNIFGCTERKLIKKILELNKRVSACTLIGNIMWYPEQFLLKHIHSIEKYIDQKSIENHRVNLTSNKTLNFSKDSNTICSQVCLFIMEIEKVSQFKSSTLNIREIHIIINLVNRGLKLVRKINFMLKWMLNIYADKNLCFTKTVLVSICKLIESLKCIYNVYQRNAIRISYILLMTIQHLSHKALSVLLNTRKQFTQEKSYKEHQLDVLSAFNLCEHVLKGPYTNQNLLLANLALSSSGLSVSILSEIQSVLKQLEIITNFSASLRTLSNCSFIYWHQNYILPIYFSKLIAVKADLSRYGLMINALGDTSCCNTDYSITDKLIEDHYYKPLEQMIEVNLRLQTHLHLQLPYSDPFDNYFSINFNKCQPVAMYKVYKNIKKEAEHHLSTVFYNLTSVVLHDWKTYGEMRRLAHIEYGLETIDDSLPMQTLEQGLDVLQIMRNINIFVNKYMYNLNSQVFIEKCSNNKHLNSINISHITNSIRTHGVGIMNTTVNYTYQFLRTQFQHFSQFLFDEHVKSRLIKDIKFFSDHKSDLNQMYPYHKADKFNSGIKKLGLNEQRESYLDLFRKVITNIGNAMGYVRLIKSGGRRCLAEGTCFIPNLKNINVLDEVFENDQLPGLTKSASTELSKNLQMFSDNIDEATEYYRLLVKVFEPVLRNKNNMHLQNFYVIVPPLTVNFIEYILNCKEKINKRNNECSFTDDGFALGLAYVIEILDQESKLNSLHWFHSVQKNFAAERQKVEEQMKNGDKCDDKLNQTLTLTSKRISLYETEFQLLYYNFNSARLFFQN